MLACSNDPDSKCGITALRRWLLHHFIFAGLTLIIHRPQQHQIPEHGHFLCFARTRGWASEVFFQGGALGDFS